MFIYQIYCSINKKSYVGKSIKKKFYNRYSKNEWWRGTDNKELIKDYNIYGYKNFIVKIILENIEDIGILRELEGYYCKYFNSMIPNGYNCYMPDTDINGNIAKNYLLNNKEINRLIDIEPATIEPLQIENEIWKPIKNYENLYEISNIGRIKALEKITFATQIRHNKIYKLATHRKSKILKLSPAGLKGDYHKVVLSNNGKEKRFYIQCLVATAFILNPDNLPQVNHIDGNKINNKVENLEWVNNSGNQLHAYRIGLKNSDHMIGEGHKKSKLTNKKVLDIRQLYLSGKYTKSELGRMFFVHPSLIHRILIRKNWKHI